jgi:hypothetical protein
MVERADPARTGVYAGRVVGVLTTGLAVVSLLRVESSVYAGFAPLLEAVGVPLPLPALFWGNVVIAALSRYAVCYVVGSLIGVLYDWLEESSPAVLVVVVLLVGGVDGALATLDTRNALVGAAYILAWLVYVPVFVWLFDEDAARSSGPRRL